jgi:hypothetical protein
MAILAQRPLQEPLCWSAGTLFAWTSKTGRVRDRSNRNSTWKPGSIGSPTAASVYCLIQAAGGIQRHAPRDATLIHRPRCPQRINLIVPDKRRSRVLICRTCRWSSFSRWQPFGSAATSQTAASRQQFRSDGFGSETLRARPDVDRPARIFSAHTNRRSRTIGTRQTPRPGQATRTRPLELRCLPFVGRSSFLAMAVN